MTRPEHRDAFDALDRADEEPEAGDTLPSDDESAGEPDRGGEREREREREDGGAGEGASAAGEARAGAEAEAEAEAGRPTSPVRPALAHLGMLACVLLVVVALGERAVRTPDAYFHLHIGREILASQQVPRENRYLAYGRGDDFVNIQWGFQAGIAALEWRYGLEGPMRLRDAMSALAAILVYALGAVASGGARASPLGGALAAALFLLAAKDRFLLAPEVVSIALLALSHALLETRARWPRAVWALPPLAALWMNVHGFAALLPVLVLAHAIGDLWHARRVRLFLVLAVTIAALGLNPYGLEGALYPLQVADDREGRAILAELIVELGPALGTAARRSLEGQALLMTLGLALAGVALAGRARWRVDRALVAVAATALGVGYVRNAGLAAALAAPLAVAGLGAVAGRLAARIGPGPAAHASRLAALLLAAGLIGAAWGTLADRGDARRLEGTGLGARFADAIDHERAIAFCVDTIGRGFPVVVWNDLSTGHALIERTGGQLRPVLCPQTDLSRPVLPIYADALEGRVGVAALLAAFPADAFFVDHRRLAGSPLLAELLSPEGGFALVYVDGRSAVFLRRTDRLRGLVRDLALDLAALAKDPERHVVFLDETREEPARPWVRALYAAGIVRPPARLPRERLDLALFLYAAGEREGAERLVAEAARRAPHWAPVAYAQGILARAAGQLDLAKEHLRRAARGLGAAEPHHQLGLVHLSLGELGRAEEEIARARALDPESLVYLHNLRLVLRMAGHDERARALEDASEAPAAERDLAQALDLLQDGAALAGAGRPREAERLYRRALALDPRLADAHFNLGNVLFRAGRFAEAALAYQEAVSLRPDDLEARTFLALALVELGRPDEARRELTAVLARDPAHPGARRLLARLGGS